MSEFNKKYREIINDIEKNLSNKEDLEYVKSKMADMSILFLDIIDRMSQINDAKVNHMIERQSELERKLANIEESINGIESDIYAEDGYEFEIACPYCNYEFSCEFNNENEIKEQIECPECHNMIELDWDEEEACAGNCSHCKTECSLAEEDEEYDNNSELKENDEEDDM